MKKLIKTRASKRLYLVYGYFECCMFITKSPSPVAYSMCKFIIGKFNLKAKKEWQKRLEK